MDTWKVGLLSYVTIVHHRGM